MLDQVKIDKLRNIDIPPANHVMDGQLCGASDGQTLDVISPLNGKVLTTIPRGTIDDARRAISAARVAFDDGRWSDTPPATRKKVLFKWADLIESHALEIAVLGVRDNGTEIGMAIKAEPFTAAATIRYYGEVIDKVYGEISTTAPNILGLIHREPVGVVGAIVPWNFPLMIGAWKFAPAIAAGCTVVMKPAETASLTLIRIAELGLEAGLPAGVFNIVTGQGAVVGREIAVSMDVDVLAFTGSGQVGRKLLENSAQSNLKKVYLELGGKSPNVVFVDTPDLHETIKVTANAIFRNSGQVCIAGSRLLVERSIHDEFVKLLSEYVSGMQTGDPLNIEVLSGAVNSLPQLEQNLEFVAEAERLGRTIICGGHRIYEETGGYYMAPTIITGVEPTDRLAQQEVFGPVLAVIPFDNEDEAIEIANGTEYGLASAIWTSNLSRAHRMIRSIKAGIVHVNTYGGSDLTVPLGGV